MTYQLETERLDNVTRLLCHCLGSAKTEDDENQYVIALKGLATLKEGEAEFGEIAHYIQFLFEVYVHYKDKSDPHSVMMTYESGSAILELLHQDEKLEQKLELWSEMKTA